MKFRKIIAAITAITMSCSIGVTTLSGCNECEHVYTWTINKEATCTETGLRTGVCGICGDPITESIPVNPDNHNYGDWEITAPTANSSGTATRKCRDNPSHVREIELPALTVDFEGYEMTVLSYPTQLEDGVRQLTYADQSGDVVFNIPYSAIGINTVEDAVTVSVKNKNQVRKVYGSSSSNTKVYQANKFFYEYGENYTHIIDDGDDTRSELWYTLDEDGELYAVRKANVKYNYDAQGLPTTIKTPGGSPLQDIDPNIGYMDGFSFAFYFAGVNARYYGTEGTLAGVFEAAKSSTNGDFYTEVKTINGETVYEFGFGSVHLPKYYSEITVQFTLTASLAVKKLTITTNVYDNSGEVEKWVYDEEEECYKSVSGVEPSAIEYTEFNQILISDLSPEEQANVPVSPYNRETLRVKSFDVARLVGTTPVPVDSDTPIPVSANTTIYLNITNVENFEANVNNIDFDPVEVYLRTDDGDTLLSTSTQPIGYYNPSEHRVAVRFNSAYTNTIVLKTLSGSFEKELTFEVTPVRPTRLYPELRVYGATSYIWTQGATATVYVGQPLMFRSAVDPTEEAYADKSYKAEVTSANAASATLEREEDVFETVFTASEPGTYQITMTYAGVGSGIMLPVIINVTVVKAPTGSDLFSGVTYSGRSDYPRGNVEVRSSWTNNAGSLTVTNVASGQSETLSITLDGNKLTSSHSGGADLGFVATLDEGYHLILTHPTGYGDETETIVMTRPQ